LQVFGFSYECYVPDTHMLFPHIFLNGVPRLSRTNVLYRGCLNNMFEKGVRLAILPNNFGEFHVILDKFRKFLDDITYVALRSKEKNSFIRKATNQISSGIAGNQYPLDFIAYWKSRTQYFSEWLNLDRDTIHKKKLHVFFELTQKFHEFVQNAEIRIKEWENEEYANESRQIYGELRRLKAQGLLPIESHDEDFAIISDCIVYRNHFLEVGVLYLITNDDACYQTIKKITCFQNIKGKRFYVSGFDCVRPENLLRKIKDLK